jgi:hypothetical protein
LEFSFLLGLEKVTAVFICRGWQFVCPVPHYEAFIAASLPVRPQIFTLGAVATAFRHAHAHLVVRRIRGGWPLP